MHISRHPVFISPIMTVRYFTREEANKALTELRPLMAELLERRAKAVRMSRQLDDLLDEPHIDFGGPLPAALAQDFLIIEDLLSQIKSYGCVVKSLEAGLIDFLAQINGRDVYLCWRYGEDQVAYYHELHTGFQGRKLLD
jgi:hypothetical protein